jgi:hypothetical protein
MEAEGTMYRRTRLANWIIAVILIATVGVFDLPGTPASAKGRTPDHSYQVNLPVVFSQCLPMTAPVLQSHILPYSNVDYFIAGWDPVQGAKQYQVEYTQDGLLHQDITTDTYTNFFHRGVFEFKVRAGCGAAWGPWSETQYFTVTIESGELFTSAPPIIFPADQSVIHTAFPVFQWGHASSDEGLGYAIDANTFEFQFDDDADFSSPIISENTGISNQRAIEKTRYRIYILDFPEDVIKIDLQPGTYYWRVREISGYIR